MNSSMEEEYVERLMAFYRGRVPEFVKRFSDPQLKDRIAKALPRARAWRLNSAEGIMQYVALELTAGSHFHQDSKIRAFMEMPGSSPERKVKRLLQLVQRKLEAAAQRAQQHG